MVSMLYSRWGGGGACLPACSIEDGQDDEGSEPPQDEKQVEELEKEAGIAEHKQPRKKDCLPRGRFGEGCILLSPLHAAEPCSAHQSGFWLGSAYLHEKALPDGANVDHQDLKHRFPSMCSVFQNKESDSCHL